MYKRQVSETRREIRDVPEPTSAIPVRTWKPPRASVDDLLNDDPLAAAIDNLPEEDQLDLPEPPPQVPVQMEQKQLPQNLEELIQKK